MTLTCVSCETTVPFGNNHWSFNSVVALDTNIDEHTTGSPTTTVCEESVDDVKETLTPV